MNKLPVTITGLAMLALLAPCPPFAMQLGGSLSLLGGATNQGVAHALLSGEINAKNGLMAKNEVLYPTRNMEENTIKRLEGSGPFSEEPALPATTAMLLFGAQLVGLAAAFRRYVKE